MNRNDLRRVDLNLLIVFETLMHERSVTRAAEKLFLGQPAISAALSRLRTLFDDPLFVRTGRSMEPTARAQEIFAHLSPALDSISTAMSRASEFDPATSTAVFRIGLSDDVEFGLLPPLLRRLRAEAPGIVLVVRRANYLLMPNLLASGEISVGVSYTDELPANAKRKTVRRSKPKILRADSAPGQLTLDDYCARPHALVSFAGDLSGFVDEELEKFGRKRKGGPGGAAVQRPRHPPGRHRHHRHRARLRRPGADRRRRPTRRGPTVRDPRLRTVDGLARRPGQRSGRTLAALADQHVHRRSGQSLSPPAATRTRRRNGKIDRAPRVCGLFHRKHCP